MNKLDREIERIIGVRARLPQGDDARTQYGNYLQGLEVAKTLVTPNKWRRFAFSLLALMIGHYVLWHWLGLHQ